MSLVVKILNRSPLPFAGIDLSGAPRQQTRVVAQLTGSYVATGVPVKPKDLGLRTIDHFSVGAVKCSGNTESTETAWNVGSYNATNQKLLLSVIGADAVAATTGTYTVTVEVVGAGPVEGSPNLP